MVVCDHQIQGFRLLEYSTGTARIHELRNPLKSLIGGQRMTRRHDADNKRK
jgi:hypothetical protein